MRILCQCELKKSSFHPYFMPLYWISTIFLLRKVCHLQMAITFFTNNCFKSSGRPPKLYYVSTVSSISSILHTENNYQTGHYDFSIHIVNSCLLAWYIAQMRRIFPGFPFRNYHHCTMCKFFHAIRLHPASRTIDLAFVRSGIAKIIQCSFISMIARST